MEGSKHEKRNDRISSYVQRVTDDRRHKDVRRRRCAWPVTSELVAFDSTPLVEKEITNLGQSKGHDPNLVSDDPDIPTHTPIKIHLVRNTRARAVQDSSDPRLPAVSRSCPTEGKHTSTIGHTWPGREEMQARKRPEANCSSRRGSSWRSDWRLASLRLTWSDLAAT